MAHYSPRFHDYRFRRGGDMDYVQVQQVNGTLDPTQEFIMSLLLFVIVAVALTGICSLLLWCYLFVIFGHKKSKQSKNRSREEFV